MLLRHPVACQWLEWACSALTPRQHIWQNSAAVFRAMFREACGALHLHACKLTPACLRAGGATWRFTEGDSVGRLRFAGRWASERSLEHYVQEAVAHQVLLRLGSGVEQRVACFLSGALFALLPPQRVQRRCQRTLQLPEGLEALLWDPSPSQPHSVVLTYARLASSI